MNIENIFTVDELALIDSGSYTPGRAVLDAKLDLACAMEREACAQVAEDMLRFYTQAVTGVPQAIRARGKQ
jgi:hypothetical protein